MVTVPAETRPRRSLFITLVAWYALLGGFATLVWAGAALLTQLTLQSVIALTGGVMAIVASWGLRFRKEWARQSFLGVQVYGFAVVILKAAKDLANPGARLPSGLPPDVRDQMIHRLRGQMAASAAISLLVAGFVLYKLTSRKVREEFAQSE